MGSRQIARAIGIRQYDIKHEAIFSNRQYLTIGSMILSIRQYLAKAIFNNRQ